MSQFYARVFIDIVANAMCDIVGIIMVVLNCKLCILL